EFASDEVNDGGEVPVGTIASGFGLGGLDEAVDAFEDAVVDVGGEPAKNSSLMAADGFGDLDDGLYAAVGGPKIPDVEVVLGLLGGLVVEILEGQADLVGAGGFQVAAGEVESVEL